jgi:CelD/BcsL family acetyltransferase involved in cellulose biosynthesis
MALVSSSLDCADASVPDQVRDMGRMADGCAGQIASPNYRAEISRDLSTVRARWDRIASSGAAFPFQRATWLTAWYETHGRGPDVTPLFVTIVDDTHRDVAAFPLVMRHCGGLRIIEAADAEITDYNAPLLSDLAPQTAADARRLMAALKQALPPADLLVIRKSPPRVRQLPNPVFLAGGVVDSSVVGNPIEIPGAFEDWMKKRNKHNRAQSRRNTKAFLDLPGARFIRCRDLAGGERIMKRLKCLQADRVTGRKLSYVLDDPLHETFYDRLVATGVADDQVILTALEVDGEIIAALFGVREGDYVAITRLTMSETVEPKLSPGLVLMDFTIRALYDEGIRCFDLTIGDYEFKRRLRAKRVPLYDLVAPLSWRGVPVAAFASLRGRIKRNARLTNWLRRLRDVAAA